MFILELSLGQEKTCLIDLFLCLVFHGEYCFIICSTRMAFPVCITLNILHNVLLTLHALKQYLLGFQYLFDGVLGVTSLMERFRIQELNGTAYIRLTCKLFIRCVMQFKKGLFKSYNFFVKCGPVNLDFSTLLPVFSPSLEELYYFLFRIGCYF